MLPMQVNECLLLNQPILVPREACAVKREALRAELDGSLLASSRD
jgi:hypothetical protein